MKPIIKILLFMLTVVLISQCEKESSPYVKIPDDNFLTALIELGVDTNEDDKISKSEAEALTFLDVHEASISSLEGIEVFINLDSLCCRSNELTTLDISGNTSLIYLFCAENQLTNLDLSENTVLENCILHGNQITTLDISNNPAIGSGTNFFSGLDISQMPSLFKVCVWEMPFPPDGVEVDTTGSPNVYFTTDCSK